MSPDSPTSVLRLIARVSSIASVLFLSAFIIGNIQSGENAPTAMEWIGLSLFPGGVMLGLLVAWWRELLGGGLTLLSLAGFYAWHAIVSGGLPSGPYFILLAAPAVFFLAASWLHRRSQGGNDAPATISNRVHHPA